MGWPPSPQAALRRLVRRLPLQPAQLRVMNELSPGGDLPPEVAPGRAPSKSTQRFFVFNLRTRPD